MAQDIVRSDGGAAVELRSRARARAQALSQAARRRSWLTGAVAVMGVFAGLVVWSVQRSSAEETDRRAATRADSDEVDVVRPADRAQVPSVTVVRPVVLYQQPTVDLEGSVEPAQSTSLAFSVGGTVSRISARVGDRVKAGARLAQLETNQAATQFAVTGARVRAATAQLTLALDHAERSTALVASGSLHAASAVDSQLRCQVAEAELEAVRAQHAQAQLVLNEHTLRAPFAGTVVEAPQELGAVVSAGAKLFRLAKLDSLKVRASVTEADATRLVEGARVVVDAPGGEVLGEITRVRETLDSAHRVPVEIAVAEPGVLRAGAFVRARADATGADHVLRLPSDVLLPGTRDEVFVVVAQDVVEDKPRIAVRKLTHDVSTGGDLLVRGGLRPDELVVSGPDPERSPGELVKVGKELRL